MRTATPKQRLIVVPAFERVQLLDVSGPVQTFASTNEIVSESGRDPPYRIAVVSRGGGPVCTSSGLPLVTQPAGRAIGTARIDTLIIPGGPGVHEALKDKRMVAWARLQSGTARRVASVCTGAFLLAETGLLDGRRATTHWKSCGRLQQCYPKIHVEHDPIYVTDGKIWTSAGVTAGIDLALALVEADLGRSIAMRVARQLVVFLNRPGGQSQFSAPLEAQAAAADGNAPNHFAPLHGWIAEHLTGDLRVERLAEQAGMSPAPSRASMSAPWASRRREWWKESVSRQFAASLKNQTCRSNASPRNAASPRRNGSAAPSPGRSARRRRNTALGFGERQLRQARPSRT